MAEVVTKLLEPVVEEIGKSIFASIKRQFSYLCCFSSNIQSLRDEAQKLEVTRDALLIQVSEAENNAHEIFPAVRTWLLDTNDMQVKIAEIEACVKSSQSGCLKNICSYSISKKAREMVEAIMDLQKCREQLDLVSHPPPPPSMVPLPLGQIHEFQSRKQIEEDVMTTLQDMSVTVVGLAGIGGVGKTTMAKKIMHRMITLKVVDEAIMVVVSQEVDLLKIQLEIAELLGFKELKNWETLQARAHQLSARLLGSKRILIVLDDVWEKLNMEILGIPNNCCSRGCVVLLTSRNVEVLKQMNALFFSMPILPEHEAWSLFESKVGNCANDPNLMFVARDVARECKGLPIAITVVGSALRDQEKGIWEDALDQLKSSNPINLPQVLEDIYNPLRLSYKFLKTQSAKSLFLLCCLFPEDSDISIEDLTLYGFGLNKIDGVFTLDRARNRALSIVTMLKNLSLLLDGKDKHHVKMHDVIRDMAIFIASEEGLIDVEFGSRKHFYTKCEWITEFPKSSDHSLDHLTRSQFPNLRLLIIHKKIQFWKALEANGIYFIEGMKELKVLSLENMSFSLSDRIGLLKNISMLNLVDCTFETISAVGELSSLEILICYRCRNIRELPCEISCLKCLKLLNLSSCYRLKRVAPKVIENLVELEELKILDSFNGWESTKVHEGERKNASLKELESLTKISCLEIQVGNPDLADEDICLSPSITKYKILIGDEQSSTYDKVLALHQIPRDCHVGRWMHVLARTVEELSLSGHGSRNFEIHHAMSSIKSLKIQNCPMLEELVNASNISRSTIFPALECLDLSGLPNFKEICNIPILDGFMFFGSLRELSLEDLPLLTSWWKNLSPNVYPGNLIKIKFVECHKLRNIFLFERVGNVLVQLEEIRIEDCETMKEVFCNEEDENGSLITFPKLEFMQLFRLQSLNAFAKGIESIKFPLLKELFINDCPSFKAFMSPVGIDRISTNPLIHDEESSHLFCNEKVSFDGLEELMLSEDNNVRNIWCKQIPEMFFKRLKTLSIFNYNSIVSSFSVSVAQNLLCLKHIMIGYCKNMEKVISDDGSVPENSLLFPRLERIDLMNLPKLGMFYEWRCTLEFPLLKEIKIDMCPQMEFFTSISPSIPNLKRIQVNDNMIEGEALAKMTDLNGFIRRHKLPVRKESTSDEDNDEDEEEKLVKIVKEDQEIIHLDAHGLENLDLSQIQNNAKALKIIGWEMLEQIVTVSTSADDWRGLGVFPVLKYLALRDLPKLKEICDIPISEGSNSFKNLRKLSLWNLPSLTHLWMSSNQHIVLNNLCEIRVNMCQELRNLFPLRSANALLQLEILQISMCGMMTQVFQVEGNGNNENTIHIKFPRLKEVELSWLYDLETLGGGIESIEFPILEKLRINFCPKLRSIVSPIPCKQRRGYGCNNDDESLHLFCNKVQFGGLKFLSLYGSDNKSNIWCREIPMCFFSRLETLVISGYSDILSLFLPSMAENLVSLKDLSIANCKRMEIVIAYRKEVYDDTSKLFQSLERLELSHLPLLGIFAEWTGVVKFPSLMGLNVYGCPLLESLTLGSLIAPKLIRLCVDSNTFEKEELIGIDNLNDTLRRHILSSARMDKKKVGRGYRVG